MKQVLIMAGGTGGHVFPALAVAQALQAQGVKVSWLGTKSGIEAEVIPKANIEIDWISINGLRGKGLFGWLQAPYKLLLAAFQAQRIIKKRNPDLVIGMGGFVTGPGGFVAYLNKKPLLIHEQNAIPGLTNRLLGRLANKVLEAFPGSFDKKYHAIALGNPVREAFQNMEAPEIRMANRMNMPTNANARTHNLRLLVVGGSLGAMALNIVMPKTLKKLAGVDVWHQTGKRHYQDTKKSYDENHLQARVEPFIDDMVEAYSWADIVLCRSGALTVSELAAVGVGSILVPFPHAVDDHQTKNAEFLVSAGAAELLPQNELTADSLGTILSQFINDRPRILTMAKAAFSKRQTDSVKQVITYCGEIANV